jgi:pyrimidine-nucleoside phosphorylase/thymidine phosphorylase
MNARAIIEKKRDGGTLTAEEIKYFIDGCTSLEIPDYHAASLLMAIFFRGMTTKEVLALTGAMRDSGDVLDLSCIPGKKVDKHSTGGVGDKTSLVVAPIAAACGVTVPMISGRALGHTGGTLDKLQSIPGFDTEPPPACIVPLLLKNKAIMIGATHRLAPADWRLYALRDATGTVESIPLITSSILSKKLSEDIDGLVLDVKTGSGSFLPTKKLSMDLARSIATVCRRMGTRIAVLITDMEQPLGRAVGNALEVKECIEFLNGSVPEDLETVSLALAAEMIRLAGMAKTQRQASRMAYESVSSGKARQTFLDIVASQGGDIRAIEDPNLLPKAKHVTPFKAKRAGVVVRADAKLLGQAANVLGAGRLRTDDVIDPAVGLYLHKKTGDAVQRGEPICDVHWNDEKCFESAMPLIAHAFDVGSRSPRPRPLIHAVFKG